MIIPRKFQLQEINDEPDDQRRLREKRVFEDYRIERELLELRAGSHESQYQTTDNSMTQEINQVLQVCTARTAWSDSVIRSETSSITESDRSGQIR